MIAPMCSCHHQRLRCAQELTFVHWNGMTDNEVVHVLDVFLKEMDELECREQVQKHWDRTREPTSTAPCKNTIPSWRRRKQELITLRQQSQEMETRVEFLKLQQNKRRTMFQKQRHELHKIKGLVDKENQRRQQVERENEALKCQLKACIRLSSTFQAAIATALVDQAAMNNVVALYATMQTTSLHQLRISSANTFKMLEERVDKRFQTVQVILDEVQLASVSLDEEQMQFDSGQDEGAAVMKYKCARVLPFDERATSNAAWDIIEIGGVMQKQASYVVRRSSDVYAVDSRFVMPLDHDELMMVDVHCVIKRFVVPEGILLLGEASSDWLAHRGSLTLWNQQSRESLLCMVHGVPQEPACQLKAVARSEVVRQVSHSSRDPESFSRDRAFFSFRELIDSHCQFLENTLWDSARNAGTQQTQSL